MYVAIEDVAVRTSRRHLGRSQAIGKYHEITIAEWKQLFPSFQTTELNMKRQYSLAKLQALST